MQSDALQCSLSDGGAPCASWEGRRWRVAGLWTRRLAGTIRGCGARLTRCSAVAKCGRATCDLGPIGLAIGPANVSAIHRAHSRRWAARCGRGPIQWDCIIMYSSTSLPVPHTHSSWCYEYTVLLLDYGYMRTQMYGLGIYVGTKYLLQALL